MRGLARMHLPACQRGAVVLILLALASVLFIYAVVSGLNRSAAELAQARAQKTADSLAQAKEALIAYAATYKDTHDDPGSSSYTVPGYLPCPDLGPPAVEGQAAGSCGSSLVSVMGRLPWKTLGLDTPKDGSGECLWYAVSGTYKNNPNSVSGSTTTSNMMNWDTNGQFDVKDASNTHYLAGSTADTNAVAVIFAPGAALSGQNRSPVAGTAACGGNFSSVPAAAAYLETSNGINNSVVSGSASAQSTFIAGTSSSTFNDQLVFITRADIWNAIKRRSDFSGNLRALTRRAAECTAMYGTQNSAGANDKRLPWASNVSLSTTSVPTYAVNASYNDTSGTMSGRLSFKVNTAAANTATHNNLSSSISDWGTSSNYIFTNSSYCSYRPEEKIWYENWKDQLFYALANNYDPGTSSSTQSCPTCLKINGSGNFAAVVIFAGDKLTNAAGQVTQFRSVAANTDKGLISNYLEGRNSSNHPNSGGNGNYQAAASSSTFNDIVYAIDTNLKVQCYSPTSNSMVLAPAADPAPLSPPGPPPHFPLGGAMPPVTPYAACP